MNSVHIHLVVTHLPVVGAFLGFPILLIGIIKKNLDLKFISYGIYIVCAISAGYPYITGEDAEEIVEELPGISETLIEQHEHFATYSLTSIIILGIIVLLSIIVFQNSIPELKKHPPLSF